MQIEFASTLFWLTIGECFKWLRAGTKESTKLTCCIFWNLLHSELLLSIVSSWSTSEKMFWSQTKLFKSNVFISFWCVKWDDSFSKLGSTQIPSFKLSPASSLLRRFHHQLLCLLCFSSFLVFPKLLSYRIPVELLYFSQLSVYLEKRIFLREHGPIWRLLH